MTPATRDAALPAWTGPLLAALLLAFSLLSLRSNRPPEPKSAGTPDTAFSAERARAHLERIARSPHPVGSPAHDSVGRYLLEELRELGVDATLEHEAWVPSSTWRIRVVGVRNVVARLPGTDPTGTLALVSHYDSEIGAPGAGDAGASVAAILETVRALRAGPPLRNDLVVLITDAEELGLIGARQFLASDTAADSVTVAINLEGRGTEGQVVLFETGPDPGPLVRAYDDASPSPRGSSLYPAAYEYLPNSTDFAAFLGRGRTGLNLAHAAGADAYHMPTDAVDRVPDTTLQHQGDHALALVRRLGNTDLGAVRGGEVTYFTAPAIGFVLYPMGLVLPLALLAAALLAGILLWGRWKGVVSILGALAGAAAMIPMLGLTAFLGWLVWRAGAAVHPEAGTLIGQRFYDEGVYMWVVVTGVMALTLGMYQLLRRWFDTASLALGAHLLPVALAVGAAVAAPGAAYLATWPALLGLGAAGYLVARGGRVHGWSDIAALVAPAVLALLLFTPHLPMFLIGLSIMFAALFAVLAVLLVVPVLPLLDPLGRPSRWWLPALTAAVALVLLGIGLAGAGVDDERPAAANLVYLLDRDTGEARWATAHEPGDPWLDAFVGSAGFTPAAAAADRPDSLDRRTVEIADWISIYGPRTYRAGPAEGIALPPLEPVISTVSDRPDRVHLELAPPAGAMGLILTAPDSGWVPVRVEGEEVLLHPAFWRVELWDVPPDGSWSIELLAPLGEVDAGFLSLVTVRPGLPRLEGLPERPADRIGTGVLGSRAAFTDLTVTRRRWRP